MFILELKFHASTQKLVYATKEAADAALAVLQTKMGERYRNDDPTHTIVGPTGTTVVVCSKVESASVLDNSKYEELVQPLLEQADDRAIAFEVRKRAALATASTDKS